MDEAGGAAELLGGRKMRSSRLHIAAGRVTSSPSHGPFSELFNVAASRPAQIHHDVQPVSSATRAWRQSAVSARQAASRSLEQDPCPAPASSPRRRSRPSSSTAPSAPSGRSTPTRSSRPASICASAPRPGACARASCRARRARRAERIADLALHEIDLTPGRGAGDGLRLYRAADGEPGAAGRACVAATNPKSSTGRLDVFTRVITDHGRAFDQVEAGYDGPLYAEIGPRTFPVLVRAGSRLSQIRFRAGRRPRRRPRTARSAAPHAARLDAGSRHRRRRRRLGRPRRLRG